MTLSTECYYRRCDQCVDMPNNECSCECHRYQERGKKPQIFWTGKEQPK